MDYDILLNFGTVGATFKLFKRSCKWMAFS